MGPRTPPEVFSAGSAVDKDTKLANLRLFEALRESMKSTSETRILSLRIHDALVKVRVPSYPEVYECRFDHPLSELTGVDNKLALLLDAGTQVLKNNFAR
jgi:hypothetical protein